MHNLFASAQIVGIVLRLLRDWAGQRAAVLGLERNRARRPYGVTSSRGQKAAAGEATAILGGAQPGHFPEQAEEGARICVSDGLGNGFDLVLFHLQELFCLA
jgi:hypothetical protein